jgi:hypothetical protein
MEWVAFSLSGSFEALSLRPGSRHANGDPARFSQYHSGFFKAGLPRRRVRAKNPFAWT